MAVVLVVVTVVAVLLMVFHEWLIGEKKKYKTYRIDNALDVWG